MSATADFNLAVGDREVALKNHDFEMVVGAGVRITYRSVDEAFELTQDGPRAFEVLLCTAPCHTSAHSIFVLYSRSRNGAYICRGTPHTAQVFVSCSSDEAETMATRLRIRLGDAD